MQIPIQVHFLHMPASAAIEEAIVNEAPQLEYYYSRIVACRVTVEETLHRHRKRRRFSIRIILTIPGDEMVINHEQELNDGHEDPYLAVRQAFVAARRALQHRLHSREDSRKARSN